jgi:putative ABC transport system ATP-binding protein
MIELRGVCKSYLEGGQRRRVLDGLGARIADGERVALVGRSGAGKSTVLNLLAGLERPDAGEVLVDGQDLARLDERARTLFRRYRIGFVFQFFNLVPTLTVLENLLLPLELVGRARPAAAARARALALLARVGLADRGNSFPERLSGGEQQRVAIARALIHEPRLLLADEPTGTLDEDTGRTVLGLLTTLCREQAMTMVMVTHSPDVAAHLDRVLRVVDGRAVEAGRCS